MSERESRVAGPLPEPEPTESFGDVTNRFLVSDPRGRARPRGDPGRTPHRRLLLPGRGADTS